MGRTMCYPAAGRSLLLTLFEDCKMFQPYVALQLPNVGSKDRCSSQHIS